MTPDELAQIMYEARCEWRDQPPGDWDDLDAGEKSELVYVAEQALRVTGGDTPDEEVSFTCEGVLLGDGVPGVFLEVGTGPLVLDPIQARDVAGMVSDEAAWAVTLATVRLFLTESGGFDGGKADGFINALQQSRGSSRGGEAPAEGEREAVEGPADEAVPEASAIG